MSETPAETIRRAARQLRDPVFCGDRATPAIADWLDETAEQADKNLHRTSPIYLWSCDHCQGEVEHDCTCWDSALKVARAYLGEAG